MESSTVKFPKAKVNLTRVDGNAFAGATKEEQAEFLTEATSGNYDNLLQTVIRWVEIG